MTMVKTVKARAHYGATSLNLTIPAEIRKIYGLEAGDVFELKAEKEKDVVILSYKRVYSIK